MKRNVLTIFLASPSDLQDERKIVRNIADRANKILSRRIGWHIELLGWEDTLPSYSRPQELINKDVDSCDLFIGILWRRWGQDTGKYSSGFEEEFIRARDRRKNTGKPEIWLFFKSIDEEIKSDPGDQLKKVLKFRDDQIRQKELLFKEFEDSVHCDQIIYDHLMSYVLDLTAQVPKPEYEEQSISLKASKEGSPDIKKKPSEPEEQYPSELVDLFRNTSNRFINGQQISLDVWEATRIYLQSSIWFSEVHKGEVFGNHEINIAYLKRKEWNLSKSEEWFLLRSFISDQYDNRPGWFWLKKFTEKEITRILILLSFKDNNKAVRKGAIKLLADSGAVVSKKLLETWLKNDDIDVVLNALKALRNNNKIAYSELLEPLIGHKDSQIKDQALNLKIELLYQNNPEDAFSYLIQSGSKLPPLIEKTLAGMSLKVNQDLLFQALEKADSSVRLFCAKYLRKAGLLTKANCENLFKDPDARVRKEGLLRYIELGTDVDMDLVKKLFPEPPKQERGYLGLALKSVRADDFLPIILRKRNSEELLSELDFFKITSIEAYRFLALGHFSVIEERIRSDLDDEFEGLRKESELRLKNQYGEASEIIINQFEEDVIQFVKVEFVSAALDGLAKNGNKSDVKYARKYICNTKNNNADKESIKVLAKFGDSSDVAKLLQAASNAYGETKRLAIQTAYRYVSNKGDFIIDLLSSDDSDTSELAIRLLSSSKISKKFSIAKNLLNDKNDTKRLKGLSIIFRKCSLKGLEQLLSDYIAQDTYYYNIITWLDRYLYSKGRYRRFYHNKLANIIQQLDHTYNHVLDTDW